MSAGSPHRGSRHGLWTRAAAPTAFVAAWLVHRCTAGDREVPLTLQNPVLPEAVKLVLAVLFFVWQRRRRGPARGYAPPREESLPLSGVDEDGVYVRDEESRAKSVAQLHGGTRVPPSVASACVLLAAVLFTLYKHNLAFAEVSTDPISVWVAVAAATAATGLLVSVFVLRNVSLPQWQSIMLQIAGLCIIQSSIISSVMPVSTYHLLSSLALSISLYTAFMDYIYTHIHSLSISALHVMFFACTLIISGISFAARSAQPAIEQLQSHLSSSRILVLSFTEAVFDLTLLATIYSQDAVAVGVLQSLSAGLYLLGFGMTHGLFTVGFVAGSSLAILGAIAYLASPNHEVYRKAPYHLIVRLFAMLALIGSIVWAVYTAHETNRTFVEDHQEPYRASILDHIPTTNVETCSRKIPPSVSYYPGNRTYHAFDDVLLVVFFSHARYDANLDYYREVYSEFFPNIVFVGPGSRQDAGFAHSYDVLVDSYEADEDLTGSWYKMAGRMAHHMLYTAMREYPCYGGYLWAPFDTLLNVPRLQQFDQRYVWYHSPFAQYVPNPALGDDAANQNKTRHPPPANISPDPAVNLTAAWRHWGVDWWWGEPHVGVHVCMSAFNKVPLHMREHLASLTNGTRLIGGSADTLYIPGRHYDAFMHVLGLFLETDCFLEIATPTALHLISPPGDPILYVDHWWIWQPPFNATFVRQKWAEGMEVDTFHTFHWGDKGPDGVWKGNPAHIPDVRRLQAESAKRQGIAWSSNAD